MRTKNEQLDELYCKLGFEGDISAGAKSRKIASALTRRTFTTPPTDLIADIRRMLGKLQPPEVGEVLKHLDGLFAPAAQPAPPSVPAGAGSGGKVRSKPPEGKRGKPPGGKPPGGKPRTPRVVRAR